MAREAEGVLFEAEAGAMTLEPYSSSDLDSLALRMLDLAARIRKMSKNIEDHGLPSASLHSKKAIEWIDKLDQWAIRSGHDLEMTIIKQHAAEQAKSADEK